MTVPAPTSTRTAAPQSVVLSHWLYIVGAVLGLVVTAVSLLTLPAAISAAKATLARSGSSSKGVDIDAIATGTAVASFAIGALFAVAFAILTIVFARKMLAGRNWARIVLTVFAAVQIVGVASAYGLGALHFLVLLAALILSWVGASNAYFRSRSTRPSAAL